MTGKSSLRNFQGKVLVATHFRCLSTTVDENSWASEFIKQNGGTVVPAQPSEPKELSEESLNAPSEKVQKLIDEICKLSVAEAKMLGDEMAVSLFALFVTRIALILLLAFRQHLDFRLGFYLAVVVEAAVVQQQKLRPLLRLPQRKRYLMLS